MSRCKKWMVGIAIVVGAGLVLAAAAAVRLAVHGVSARDNPTAAEAWAARAMRRLATPNGAKELTNPVPADAAALAEAREHFADHCAQCHGNDGRGRTTMGQSLYPKAPDMTAAGSQGLSDGELFYVITNGIRLTGMPAWGERTADDDRATWQLVSFIRTLPSLTPTQLEDMKAMNPKSRSEFEEEEKARRWLEGGGTPDATADHPDH